MNLRLLIAGAALMLPAALSAQTTTLDFNGLTGGNGTPFSTYSEGGYTVSNSAGQYQYGQVYGNPAPSLFSGFDDTGFAPTATASASIIITADNGVAFDFDSADVACSLDCGAYTFSGISDAGSAYLQTGTLPTGVFFTTIDSSSPMTDLTSLTITEAGGDYNVDNIVLNAATSVTPEPSSFLLLGTGLMGVAGTLRRRLV